MCPRALIPGSAWEAIEVWSRWRLLRVLPFPGPLEAQPVWVLEAIEAAELGTRGPSDHVAPEPLEVEEEAEAQGDEPKALAGLSPALQAYFARKVDNAT